MGTTPAKGSGYKRQGCYAYVATQPVTFTSGNIYQVKIDTGLSNFNDDAMLDAANNQVKIAVSGRYKIWGHVNWQLNTANSRAIYINITSADYGSYIVSDVMQPVATYGCGMVVATEADLKKNDTVILQVYQNSGGNLTANNLALRVQEIG